MARGAGVRVVEHVACPFAGGNGQDELGVGPAVAYGDPTLGGRLPRADLDAGVGAVVKIARQAGEVVAHVWATNEHPPGGQPGQRNRWWRLRMSRAPVICGRTWAV